MKIRQYLQPASNNQIDTNQAHYNNTCQGDDYISENISIDLTPNQNPIENKKKIKKRIKCPQEGCNISILKSNLSRHIKNIHKKEVFYCLVCNKDIQRRYFNEHTKIHMAQKAYNCDICFESFTKLAILKQHKIIKHDIAYSRLPLSCDICGIEANKRFLEIRYLTYHINTVHSKRKQYNCGECSASFSQYFQFKMHQTLAKHNGISLYINPTSTIATENLEPPSKLHRNS